MYLQVRRASSIIPKWTCIAAKDNQIWRIFSFLTGSSSSFSFMSLGRGKRSVALRCNRILESVASVVPWWFVEFVVDVNVNVSCEANCRTCLHAWGSSASDPSAIPFANRLCSKLDCFVIPKRDSTVSPNRKTERPPRCFSSPMDAVVLFPVTAPNNGEDDDNDDGVEDDNDDVIVAFLPPLGGYLPVLVLVLLYYGYQHCLDYAKLMAASSSGVSSEDSCRLSICLDWIISGRSRCCCCFCESSG